MALSDRIVVMNKGKIDQIGSPSEIYDNPLTRHVAAFIGNMNFIRIDEHTEWAVRPENVCIRSGKSDDLSAVVRTVMLMGHYVTLSVELNGSILRCNVDRDLADTLHPGDNVAVKLLKYHVLKDGEIVK